MLILLASATTTAAAPPAVLRTDDLGSGVTSVLRADGSLEFRSGPATAVFTLRLETPQTGPDRRRFGRLFGDGSEPFVGRVAEGCPGGHRGPGRRADDDGDGLSDEDRLDGRDNDGDGRIDEDFAAIGDAMIAVTRPAAAGGGHLEFFSWAHVHLRSTVFLAARGAAGSRLALTTGGSAWAWTRIDLQQHGVTGRIQTREAAALVSELDRDGTAATGGRWLGVAVLERPEVGRVGTARIDGGLLTIATGDAPVAVAVCVADSWLQLSRMLVDAVRIRAGVADPVTGETTSWVVPPRCPACRNGAAPAFRWRIDRQGALVLAALLDDGAAARLDPDLFQFDDRALGAPDRISWRPRSGDAREVAWFPTTARRVRDGAHPGDPYADLAGASAHDAVGRLEFRFPAPEPGLLRALAAEGPDAPRLSGVTVDGRALTATPAADVSVNNAVTSAVALARGSSDAEAAADPLGEGGSRPNLSPALLQGWPNPFHDAITLRFTIPETLGEAFTWNSREDWPAHLDPAAPVPWKSGAPQATVKIYTMSGQHLVTLHASEVAAGSVTVHWNATDSFGRRVASGGYICKLQLDDWSVARRLTFVR